MEELDRHSRIRSVRRKIAGTRMRALREGFDVSVEECAQALGLTPAGISEREIGRRPLLVGEFWRFCSYLGVSPADFFAAAGGPRGRLPAARRLRLQRKMLGASLAEGREGRGWSLHEAATQAHMTEERLRLCELGQEELTLADVEALAELYGIGLDCLAPGAAIGRENVSEREGPVQDGEASAQGLAALPADLRDLLQRPEAERYLRAALALGQLPAEALTALEDAIYFLRGSA